MNGAIELTIGDTPVLTAAEWDDIRDLWIYLSAMVKALHDGEPQAHTLFPDQSLLVKFARLRYGMVEVIYDSGSEKRRGVTGEAELIQALCEAGISFFDHLDRLGVPPDDYRHARGLLAKCLHVPGPAGPAG